MQFATLQKANLPNLKDKDQQMNPENNVNEDITVFPENPSTCYSVLEDPNYHPNTGDYSQLILNLKKIHDDKNEASEYIDKHNDDIRSLTSDKIAKSSLAFQVVKVRMYKYVDSRLKDYSTLLKNEYKRTIGIMLDNILDLLHVQLAFTNDFYPRQNMCYCPYSSHYRRWCVNIFQKNMFTYPPELSLVAVQLRCDNVLSANSLYLHTEHYKDKCVYHRTFYEYFTLLFTNEGKLRQYNRDQHINVIDLHYNERNAFSDLILG